MAFHLASGRENTVTAPRVYAWKEVVHGSDFQSKASRTVQGQKMIIQKEYKFYAAHRNETLHDKCSNIHGHRYGLRIHFEVERDGDISTLFGAFDDKIEPYLKNNYDHGMLINKHDPLYQTLLDHCERTGDNFRLKVFDGSTSVENLAWIMFSEITEMGFQLDRIEVQETDTSTIIYTKADWQTDNKHFAATEKQVLQEEQSSSC